MMGNGSMDQAVVVLVNEAIFAYFDHTKQTFVLRPSASAGFSVLEKRDSTFCLTEVIKGFPRQEKYVKKLKEETRSKPRLGNLMITDIIFYLIYKFSILVQSNDTIFLQHALPSKCILSFLRRRGKQTPFTAMQLTFTLVTLKLTFL